MKSVARQRNEAHDSRHRPFFSRSQGRGREPFFRAADGANGQGVRVSRPGDREEAEAEQTADRVVERMSTPLRHPGPDVHDVGERISRVEQEEPAQRQPEHQEPTVETTPILRAAEEEAEVANVAIPRQAEEEQAEVAAVGGEKEPTVETTPILRAAEEETEVANVAIPRQAEEEQAAVRGEKEPTVETTPIRAAEEEPEMANVALPRQAGEEQAEVAAAGGGKEPEVTARQPEEDEAPVQARSTAPVSANAAIRQRLLLSKGRARPLPVKVQADLGSAFGGRDFSNIRVHTDTEAVALSRDLNAQAFAHGRDVYFNEGRYNPDSREGLHLLAHELAHTIQQGKAPLVAPDLARTTEEDLAAELRESDQDARQAIDPHPAENAQQQADRAGSKAESEARTNVPAPAPTSRPPKPEDQSEARVAKATRRIPDVIEPPQDAAPKGEVGQYLDMQSAGVCSRGAAKAQRLADNEQAHDPAAEKRSRIEAAVKPPDLENQSRKNADQVQTVQRTQGPSVDPAENRRVLDVAIEQSVPNSVKALNEFKEKGKGKVIGSAALGAVTKDVGAVRGTYGEIQNVAKAEPPELPEVLPEMEVAPATGRLNLGKGAVPPIAEEHTDFSSFDRQSDDLIKNEKITDEQLAMVDNGDLAEAHRERQGLKTTVAEVPIEARKFAEEQVSTVDAEMVHEENATRTAMAGKRRDSLGATNAQQKATRTELEVKREAVTRHVNGLYEKAKTNVTLKLDNLEAASLRRFDRDQRRYSIQFEYEVNRDVRRWKSKRYSGIFAAVKWLKDKAFGIDHFPEVKRAFADARATYVGRIDQLILDINRDNEQVILSCKNELLLAKTEIQEFVSGLGPDLAKAGETAQKEMQRKLADLEGFVDKRKKELQQKLCEKKDAAIEAIDRKIEDMKASMSGIVGKIGQLLLKAAIKFFKWALEKAGLRSDALMSVLNKGVAVIKKIVTSPIQFFKNLAAAVGSGIDRFVKNIKKHLLDGFVAWLTGAIGDIGVTRPEKFDVKGIFFLALQILGLTWTALRKRLVTRVGERAVAMAEKTVEIVKRVRSEGPMALWEMLEDKLGEIKSMVMAKIRDWVILQVIKKAVVKIGLMLNPAGAIVQAVLAIYDLVMFFVENLKRIIQFAKSIISSITKIAQGAIGAAAGFIENALARTVPIILGFLARFAGVAGVGKEVRKIIVAIRGQVNRVVDPALNFVAKIVLKVTGKAKGIVGRVKAKGKAVAGKAKQTAAKAFRWWRQKSPFTTKDGKEHRIYFAGGKKDARLMVASTPAEFQTFLDTAEADIKKVAPGRTQLLLKRFRELKAQNKEIKRQIDAAKKSKEDKNTISKLRELASMTRRLMNDLQQDEQGNLDLKKTDVRYGTLTSGGEFATSMTANPLTRKGDPGSSPSVKSGHKAWNALKQRRSGAGTYYVLGHLLNDNVHGPGKEKNLSPITRKANSQHLHDVETAVKKAVDRGDTIEYTVKPKYTRNSSDQTLIDLIEKDTDPAATSDVNKKRTSIVEAEQFIPDGFVCDASTIEQNKTGDEQELPAPLKISGKWIDNTIADKSPSDYQVDSTEPPQTVLVRLSLSQPAADGHNAEDVLRMIPGIDSIRAERIVEASKAGPFKTWDEFQTRVKGIGPATTEALRNYTTNGEPVVHLQGDTEFGT